MIRVVLTRLVVVHRVDRRTRLHCALDVVMDSVNSMRTVTREMVRELKKDDSSSNSKEKN